MWNTELLHLFEESGHNVRAASGLLRDLFANFPDRPEIADELVALEHEGDRLTREIHCSAARNSDPADVHALAGALDDIVDYAEEAAGQLELYGVEAPMEQAQRMTDVLVATADRVALSLHELREGDDIASGLLEIHRLEDEADRIVRAAVGSLFATGIDPMMVIRWKDIFDTLESAVDACETVANVLEGICLKRAVGNGRG